MPWRYRIRKPLPAGVSYAGPERPTRQVEFFTDLTFLDASGTRRVEQHIFDEILRIIALARKFILLDVFLYNPFHGPVVETTRKLSEELTEALVSRKAADSDIRIVVITDPINTVYGGLASAQFDRLRHNGIEVVITDLDVLGDSNPTYSLFWRLCVRPFGTGDGEALPNPFGTGRVSVRSYLNLLNFKANHRKLVIADDGDHLVGLVTSANPHDGSSAHTNVAIKFGGAAPLDLLESENAVLEFSGATRLDLECRIAEEASELTVQIITERKIKDTVLDAIGAAVEGDSLSLAMFYLSDRDIIDALKKAHARGAASRVLLDPNKDAFGREKNGIPGRPVAHELSRAGLPVRWCDTHGEQCHMKLLLADYRDGTSALIAGSANFTRRNLENFNLETDVAVRGPSDAKILRNAREFFALCWNNEPRKIVSADYAAFADESWLKRALYQIMERSGISTF
jgi:phosphatidylserine/phosphatidylglycerophosphate/cardiolipin synthase-like enzyme